MKPDTHFRSKTANIIPPSLPKQMPITDIPEFKAVASPLRSLRAEITVNKQRLQEIHVELSQLSTKAESETAWATYLRNEPDAVARREALRSEAQSIAARQQLLEQALSEGEMQVATLRGRTSREPCKQARLLNLVEIKRIVQALDQIADANQRLSAIRRDIEDAGYQSGSLPVAGFDLGGRDESYRRYISDNYPEAKGL